MAWKKGWEIPEGARAALNGPREREERLIFGRGVSVDVVMPVAAGDGEDRGLDLAGLLEEWGAVAR